MHNNRDYGKSVQVCGVLGGIGRGAIYRARGSVFKGGGGKNRARRCSVHPHTREQLEFFIKYLIAQLHIGLGSNVYLIGLSIAYLFRAYGQTHI